MTADGQPIVWASRLLHDPLPVARYRHRPDARPACASDAAAGYRIYILGGRPECSTPRLHGSAECIQASRSSASRRLLRGRRGSRRSGGDRRWPNRHPVRGDELPAQGVLPDAARQDPRRPVCDGRWRCDRCPCRGHQARAGSNAAAGLEWLFRLAQEPRRLARRYAVTNSQFLVALAREVIRARGTSSPPGMIIHAGSGPGSWPVGELVVVKIGRVRDRESDEPTPGRL